MRIRSANLVGIFMLSILIFCVQAATDENDVDNPVVLNFPLNLKLEIIKPVERTYYDGAFRHKLLLTNESKTVHYCHQNPDKGLCKALILSYYYDRFTNTCKTFMYGGCYGNKNRFDTLEQCMDTCYVNNLEKSNPK